MNRPRPRPARPAPPPAVERPPVAAADAIADTRAWLERAVIGLNLCPFAKAVHARGQVHYATTDARDDGGILDALAEELRALVARDPAERDTTLLVATAALHDFLDFTALLRRADALLAGMGLEGTVQVASFHPDFQFAGSDADDIANATNRAPHPTLHLLREASIDRAVAAYPEADAIFGRNIERLRALGPEGWRALDVGAGCGRSAAPEAAEPAGGAVAA
ncbi:MAG: DUF1415 domain-containing protein [Xylophilus ampelinus]